MQWLIDLFAKDGGVAHSVLIVMLVAAIGMAIGHIRFKGIGLGIAGVLFVGLGFAHFGLNINHEVLEFLRDFGLVLFVYTIGIQVGPGFFASLRRNGLGLNLAAASVVVLGSAIMILQFKTLMPREQFPAAVGLMSGATTNTPSLAAAQTTYADRMKLLATSRPASAPVTDPAAVMGSAYAIAYPFGICGVLLAMIAVRFIFRINLADEQRKLAASDSHHPTLEVFNVEVVNPALDGRALKDVPTLHESGVVITRLARGDRVDVAGPESTLKLGDVLTAVGPEKRLHDLEVIIGRRTHVDARAMTSEISAERFLISSRRVAGRTIEELGFGTRFGVRITRILRSEFQLPVTPQSRLQIGDRITVVGDRDSLENIAKEVGNSRISLDKPMLVPILLGIALGVIVGSMPINLGLPVPVKLGLAGGPLVVAIILSRLHRVGPLVWYMPMGANYMLRELGIVMFLACAGLKSGESFVQTLVSNGAQWVLIAAAITILPVLLIALIARAVFKLNYLTLCGLLAGSMTDPPALSFATQITRSDAPTVAYATVYPLVMLMRVLMAQAIVITFAGT